MPSPSPACPSAPAPEPMHDSGARNNAENDFGIYIHWPFCVSKCPYCDFNSHVAGNGIDSDLWTKMLRTELDSLNKQVRFLKNPVSVFFGGGTPSLMASGSVAALLETINAHWGINAETEISLEANPESVSKEKLQAYRSAGVNRLSLGVQSFDDSALRALGRPHDVAQALSALHTARECFERVSFDLIYARPQQSVADWRAELSRAMELASEEGIGHISLYQLTIEPGTAYARWHGNGQLRLPSDETALKQLELADELCSQAGFERYEVSNYARAGEECRHNLLYWRYGFYAGIGPGAHGRLPGESPRERIATETVRDPAQWLEQVSRSGNGVIRKEPLSPTQQGDEMLLMGLRLREGVCLQRYARAASTDISGKIDPLLKEGLLWRSGDKFGCTPRGNTVLDNILAQLLT